MISYLLRRDPLAPALLRNAGLSILFLSLAFLFTASRGGDAGAMFMGPFSALAIAIALANLMQREMITRRFDEIWLTTPVSAKTLSQARYAIMMASSLVPTLTVWVAVLIAVPGTEAIQASAPFLGLVGTFGLSAALHNQLSHGQNVLGPRVWLPALGVLVLGSTLAFALWTLWFSIALVGLAVVASIYTWTTTPDWISTNRTAPQNAKLESSSDKTGGIQSPFSPETNLLLRSTWGNPVWFVFAILWGFMATIVIAIGSASLTFLPIVALNLHKLNKSSASVLRSIGHLPVNRWKLAALVVLSPMVIGMANILITSELQSEARLSRYPYNIEISGTAVQVNGKKEYMTKFSVPGNLWKIHLGTQPLTVELPEGDGHPSESMNLTLYRPIKFLPIAVYDPYETRPSSSLDFAAMQLSRLVKNGYGQDLSPKVIKEEHLAIDDRGLLTKIRSPETKTTKSLEDRYGDMRLLPQPGRVMALPVLFLVLWTLVGALSFRKRQYPHDRKRAVILISTATILICIVVVGIELSLKQGPQFNYALLHWIGNLLPNGGLIGGFCWLLLASIPALHFMRVFVVMDAPPPSELKLKWLSSK